ncbi:MAG: hypothetical protein ABI304_11490 [Rudaea sp.]
MLAETQRREILAAMGVDVYVLRGAKAAAPITVSSKIRIAVLCGKDDARHPHATGMRKLLPLALGCEAGCIDWIETEIGAESLELPSAPVCLLLGAGVARAVNVRVPNMQQTTAIVAVADAPQLSLRDALARRALWQALKPIARYLRQSLG